MSEIAIFHQLRQLLAAWITSGWPTIHPERIRAQTNRLP
jgi:hypothetical protein